MSALQAIQLFVLPVLAGVSVIALLCELSFACWSITRTMNTARVACEEARDLLREVRKLHHEAVDGTDTRNGRQVSGPVRRLLAVLEGSLDRGEDASRLLPEQAH